jgi:rhodanese-related sulfurtransferase
MRGQGVECRKESGRATKAEVTTRRGRQGVQALRLIDLQRNADAGRPARPGGEGVTREKKVMQTLLILTVLVCLSTSTSVAAADFKTIDTAQLHSMVVDNAYRIEGGHEKQFTVIDVRSKEEYDKAHIFSAVSIPGRDFEASEDLLPKNKDALLAVYCDGMKSASIKWAYRAAAAGYTNIVIYSEGFTVWKEKQLPVAPFSNSK